MLRRFLAFAIASSFSLAPAQDQAFLFESDLRLLSVDIMTSGTASSINARSGGLQYCRALTWNAEAEQLWVAEFDALNGRIGILDPATAAFTPRRLTGVPGSWVAMSWDHTTQRIYLLRQVGGGQTFLHSYQPASNSMQSIGELRDEPSTVGMDVDGFGTLWATSLAGHVFTIDKATADTTRLQTLPITLASFGIHRATGKFYGVGGIGQTSVYFEVEPLVPRWRILGSAGAGTGGFDLVDGTCPGGFQTYGTGCPGYGSFVPELQGEGCLGAGFPIQLRITRARAGTTGAIVFGAAPGSFPLGNGCSLLVAPLFPAPVLPVQILGPGGLGNGYAVLPIQIPTNVVLGPLAMQALLLDAGAPGGFSSTNGLAILVP
jgi:hypothetical protein